MSTKVPRVNVTFDEQKLLLLAHLAKENNQSLSNLIKELTLEALEHREDIFLAQLALERDEEYKAQNPIQHDDAWA